MGRIEDKLMSLGETLPQPKKAVANYLGCKQSGATLYVSGRVSPARGEVGSDLIVAEAQVAAREALLDILAIVKEEMGTSTELSALKKCWVLFVQPRHLLSNRR